MPRAPLLPLLLLTLTTLAGCATTPAGGSSMAEGREAWLAGDYRRALPPLYQAARAGNPRAQYALGYMYYYGQGVVADSGQAVQWIRRAARAGDPLAVEALGRLAGSVTLDERTRSSPATDDTAEPDRPAPGEPDAPPPPATTE
ncbi:hypothetical protein KBTX_02688 [wastewater metagenome]|uniref:Secretory immunoglobulin A-binding protein EsiB n=4 Tax=root TaxID=1 RepID=A0A5B8RCJ4_9ZZZZ|nr:hypothetical protein [Arhodomonas aquaeolei]MCS4503444.1 hypothetical protein [Arhodomonas aquaeolei]QEA06356.1 hypothetical protein KBTEX_02688 [uncultured organism]